MDAERRRFVHALVRFVSRRDQLPVHVSDGHGGTATATATIDVAPTAVADTALVDFDTPKTIDVLANDKLVDGGNVSVATVAGHAIVVGGTPVDIVSGSGVHQGTVGLNADGTLAFTPDTGITGAISFAYTVTDGARNRHRPRSA